MGPQHPEPIMIPAKGLNSGPLGHVPHPDTLVLRVGQDELLARMEDCAGDVVVVAAARIELPRLGLWAERKRETRFKPESM